jgi:hypothetical protein
VLSRVDFWIRRPVEAERLRIVSTPAFILGSVADDGTIIPLTRINGAQSFDVFANALNELKKERKVR